MNNYEHQATEHITAALERGQEDPAVRAQVAIAWALMDVADAIRQTGSSGQRSPLD